MWKSATMSDGKMFNRDNRCVPVACDQGHYGYIQHVRGCNCSDVVRNDDPVTSKNIAALPTVQDIKEGLAAFEESKKNIRERIEALEADPPVATKTADPAPDLQALLDYMKFMQNSLQYLLGRVVALEKAEKYYSAKVDLTHPFED